LPPPGRVLVVDDEPLICWSLKEVLAADGFEVTVAGSGRAALGALDDGAPLPDVVLLDYRLPDSDDLTLLERITERVRPGRVILMTAYGTPEVVQGARALGAYDVLTKPVDLDHVTALVRRACGAPPA
jgi:DNA-binding NtrC family response regulator